MFHENPESSSVFKNINSDFYNFTLAIFSYDFLLNVSTEIRPLIVETQKMYHVRKNI